jgi:hypothetical protein
LDEYRARAAARRTARAEREKEDRGIGRLRLLVFGAAVLLAALAWNAVISGAWLLAPAVAFAVLMRRHDRVIRARDAAARAVDFYERGVARLEDRWIGTGETGERFRNDQHAYAADLDLFGEGSLFELLSIARTRAGEQTLAVWLEAPAAPAEIRERHEAIRELRDELDLRESLSLAGNDVRIGVDAAELTAWAEARPLIEPWRQWAALALTVAVLGSAAIFVMTWTYLPLVLAVSGQGLFQLRQRPRIDAVLHGAETRARDLATLIDLFRLIERQHFQSRRLVALKGQIVAEGTPASAVVRHLQRLIEAHDWEHNLVFMPVAVVLMWGTHLAGAVERWRGRHRRHIGAWLDAVGEIEALTSISAYHYEHPDDPFPHIVEPGEPSRALLEGVDLGHPLVSSARMVRNDVRLGGEVGLLVVSGSNMSGKSTLLRTAGVNAVLALAGAPVRAASLRISPLSIGGTLRIQDSLQEGRSRFYAEITRVRTIVDLAQRGPMLFLLDELFHGTNSHDRLVGATGVLRRLLDLGAIGLVTTHDLALTAVADQLAPRARNSHFEDRFEAGEMIFDYRIKEGPVARSNALALMRAVGLDV